MSDRRADTDPDGITRIPDPYGSSGRSRAPRPAGLTKRSTTQSKNRRRRPGRLALVVVLLVVLALVWPATIFVSRSREVMDQCRRDSVATDSFRERAGDYVRCMFTS